MLALVVVLVVVLVLLLGVRWAQEGSRPRVELPASWQMYTATEPATYAGRDAAGTTRPLDVDGLPPGVRAVDTGRVVPGRLGAAHPEVVVVVRSGGPEPGAFRC